MLNYAGSVSSLDNSELGEISSEGNCETSCGEEADIDTTDLECTSTGK